MAMCRRVRLLKVHYAAAIACVYMCWGYNTCQSQEMTLDSALSRLKSREGMIANVEWLAVSRRPTKVGVPVLAQPDVYSKANVYYEPPTDRCRAEIRSIDLSVDAQAKYFGTHSKLSFDGKRYLSLERSIPNSLPPETWVPNDSQIQGANFEVRPTATDLRPTYGIQTGLSFAPPYFADERLTEYLGKRSASSGNMAVAMEEGLFVFRWPGENDSTCTLWADPNKGVAVKYEQAKTKTMNPYLRTTVEYSKYGSTWFPASVESLAVKSNKQLWRIDYSAVRVNIPVSDVGFDIAPPRLATVEDHVRKMTYRVGQGATDEHKAIKSFLQAHGVEAPTPPATPWWPWLAGAAFLGAAGWVWFRRNYRVAAIILAALTCENARATEPIAVHPAQCGFQVTVAALELCHIPFDAESLSRELDLTNPAGVSLAAIHDALTARGVYVEFRKCMTLGQVKQAVNDGWVGILAVRSVSPCSGRTISPKAERPNHFVMLARHPTKGVVVVNVLHSVTPLDRSEVTEVHVSNPVSMMLFCRRSR